MSPAIRKQRGRPAIEKANRKFNEHLEIKNICIPNTLKTIKKNRIHSYFQKFGNVKTVQMLYGRTRSQQTRCRISFDEASSAHAALAQSNHTVDNKQFQVLACPSWEQTFNTAAVLEHSKLLNLNDFSLEPVYQLLDLRDQLSLSICHSRLEDIFKENVCPHLVHFEFGNIRTFSFLEIRQYLRLSGRFIRTINVMPGMLPSQSEMPEVTIYDFIRKYCVGVYSLKLQCRPKVFNSFLGAVKHTYITELELHQCKLDDSHLVYLRGFRNLRSLGLSGNRSLTCVKMPRFQKLERLSLYDCICVSQSALIKIGKASVIKYLDIRGTCVSDNLDALLPHFKNVETLRLYVVYNMITLGQFTKLKSLEVSYDQVGVSTIYGTALALLIELKLTGEAHCIFRTMAHVWLRLENLRVLWLTEEVQKQFNHDLGYLRYVGNVSQLEELNLSGLKSLCGEHVIPLLEQCVQLKRLSVSLCKKIDKTFVMQAIGVLENRVIKPTKPLLIMVSGTGVKRTILCCPEYLAARDLLEVSFHCNKKVCGVLDELSEFESHNNK